LATKGLLERAQSPRLTTRQESINAFESMEALSEEAEKALINDIINNPFTTAYVSARILGSHGCASAIPLLRELAFSSDYMLAGEAMIALAKMRDKAFRSQIEQIILNTDNPRLKIMGAEALGIYGLPESLYTLLEMFRGVDPPHYLRDEAVLAMAKILDTQAQFYRILVRYLAEPALASALAMDEAESAYEFFNANLGGKKGPGKKNELPLLAMRAEKIQTAVSALVHENDGSQLSQWIMGLPAHSFSNDPAIKVAQVIFPEVLLDNEMISCECLRLLIIHWATYQIRVWTKKLK
jgi:hypothetical protein